MVDLTDKKQVREYIKENKIADLSQLNALLKTISGVFIEEILEVERDDQIGYPKHSKSDIPRENIRNGYSKKKVRGIHGEIDLDIPRDAWGSSPIRVNLRT